MKISKLLGERIESKSAQSMSKSQEYLFRAGFIKQVCNGIYSLLPPAVRVQRKIEKIIREEMDKVGGQEVLFPVMMPKELWQESGRYTSIGEEMFRLKDRSGHDMVLGMTHEEASIHIAKNTVKSYEQLPFMIYQIQTKLRDEARARAGLIRTREFTMKDAYSFHETYEDLEDYYQKMHLAYENVFRRIGMKNVISVKSDSGMMGGSVNHEFMLINPIGEDTLVVCPECDYRANNEVATAIIEKYPSSLCEQKEIYTGDKHSIEEICSDLGLETYQTCKAVVFYATSKQKYVVGFVRGDLEINETKLRNLVGDEIVPVEIDEKCELIAGNIGPKKFSDKILCFYDNSLKGENNLVVGANKKDYHISGFSFERDIQVEFNDITKVSEGHICPVCKKAKLNVVKGVEVGQIFQLDTKYTKSMNMTVHNKNGESFFPIMGCYGIGVGRAIACVAEESSDEKGLIWPMTIAPWHVYLCPLRLDDENVKVAAEMLYENLKQNGIEVIYDDRNASAGVKFADSELMGIPVRVVVSPRSLKENSVEIKVRGEEGAKLVSVDSLLEELRNLIK